MGSTNILGLGLGLRLGLGYRDGYEVGPNQSWAESENYVVYVWATPRNNGPSFLEKKSIILKWGLQIFWDYFQRRRNTPSWLVKGSYGDYFL